MFDNLMTPLVVSVFRLSRHAMFFWHAIFMLGPIWIASALLTITPAAFSYYKFAR